MDLAEAEVDDATVREELGRKKQMKQASHAGARAQGCEDEHAWSAAIVWRRCLLSALAYIVEISASVPLGS